MNPIHLIYKPGEVVKHYLDKPDIIKALIFVLLPGILSLLGLVFYGFNVNFLIQTINFLTAILGWIIASILIALIIALFSRKSAKADFYGIASAVSLTRFLGALAVFFFLLIPVVLPSDIFSSAKDFQTGKITLAESTEVISTAMDSDSFVHSLPVVSAIILLVLIFSVLSVVVYYKIISKKINSNVFVHVIALICFLFLDLIFASMIAF